MNLHHGRRRVLTIPGAARALGVTERQVRRLVAAGRLPIVEVDGLTLIDGHVLDNYAATRAYQPGDRAVYRKRAPGRTAPSGS